MAVAARTARPEFGAIKNTNLIKYNAAIHNFVKHPCAPPGAPFSRYECMSGRLAGCRLAGQLLYGHYAFKTRGHDLCLAELVTATTQNRIPKTENPKTKNSKPSKYKYESKPGQARRVHNYRPKTVNKEPESEPKIKAQTEPRIPSRKLRSLGSAFLRCPTWKWNVFHFEHATPLV